jgi:processive 1,2-diacylglycerol beta-glucosyltransferase
MKTNVLIMSEAIGNGHTKAAEALKQGISHLAPSIPTKIMEVGHTLHPLTSRLLLNIYLKMLVLSPALWRKLYQHQQDRPLSVWKKSVIYQLFHRQLEKIIDSEKPHLVICTHPFTSSSLSRLKKNGYSFTLYTVITDFHVHGAWVHPEVDGYLVGSEEVADQVMKMGVPKNRLVVTGIPICANFWIRKDRLEIQNRLKLKKIPSVMIMGGGLGLGGIKKIAYELMEWKENIQVIICTGRNEKLRKSLSKDKVFHHPHVQILGFVEDIDEWMEAIDLLITKPGGVTIFEALSKGVPMYIYQPIPGHEEKNCEYLVKKRFALKDDDSNEIEQLVNELLQAPKKVKLLKDSIQHFQNSINPLASAEFIVEFFSQTCVKNKKLP